MQGYEFVGELHRLVAFAGILERIDLEAMDGHLMQAEAVAPIFEGPGDSRGSQKIAGLRRFIAKAQEFQAVCREYGMGLREAEAQVSTVRQLPGIAASEAP